MAKRKGVSYEEKMMSALNCVPFPLEDKRHNLFIYFINDRARSNETRFEHIIDISHELVPKDIMRIPKYIKKAKMKKDKERTKTFNLYIPRNNYSGEYIKISVQIEPSKPNKAIVKTIFITDEIK